MAAGTKAYGAACTAAFKTHTNNWETGGLNGTLLGSGDALEILLAGIPTPENDYQENEGVVAGIGIKRPGRIKTTKWEGSIKANALYACALRRMIAAWFGDETTTSLGSGAYSHLFVPLANSTIVGNWCHDDYVLSHDVPFCKVQSLEFDWEGVGAIPTMTVGLIGQREYSDNTGSNTHTVMTNGTVTLPTQPTTLYPILGDGTSTVRMNDHTGAQLASGNQVNPSKVNLKFARKMESFFTDNLGPYGDEPQYGAWFDISGTIGFPTFSAAADWNRLIAQTPTKLDLQFDGDLIGGGFYWRWLFQYPWIRPKSEGVHKVDGPNVLSWEVQFMVEEALSHPSGMSFARPRMTITDTTSANHSTNGV